MRRHERSAAFVGRETCAPSSHKDERVVRGKGGGVLALSAARRLLAMHRILTAFGRHARPLKGVLNCRRAH